MHEIADKKTAYNEGCLYCYNLPLSQEIRGPPVVRNNTLGVHENYFDLWGSTEQKRLRTTAIELYLFGHN
jgi:hypothetical protein